jgi:hypothetical protein
LLLIFQKILQEQKKFNDGVCNSFKKKTKERPVTKKYGTFHQTNQDDFFLPPIKKASGEKYRNQNSAPYFIEHEMEKCARKSFSLSTRVIPVHFFQARKKREKQKTLTSFLAGRRKQAKDSNTVCELNLLRIVFHASLSLSLSLQH